MSKPWDWQVAGSAPETYQRALVPAIFASWVSQVVDLANPRQGDRVLDVACGTGAVARAAASRVSSTGAVTGFDLNAGMLTVAKSVPVSDQLTTAQIHWQEGDAGKLPFPSNVFDIVYCQHGLQFFPDRPAALREMHRVLVAGGRLALTVWGEIQESPGFATLAVLLRQHIGPEAASFMQAPFSLSDPEELTALAHGAGFRDVAVQSRGGTVRFPSIEHFITNYVAGTPLAGYVSAAGEKAREHLLSESQSSLRQFVENGKLIFPIAAHLLNAST
jgi:ubiquinone/menaquinone biosynthesis C-methylase UbiE